MNDREIEHPDEILKNLKIVRSPQVPSANAPSKVASPSGAFSVPGGSLPVSSVVALLARWTTDEKRRRAKSADAHKVAQWAREQYEAEADILAGCIADLCAEMARATERQPEWEMPDGHPAYAELDALRMENNRLREKLRERLKHLRAANKGAECNALVSQLLAARMALRGHRDSSLPNAADEPHREDGRE